MTINDLPPIPRSTHCHLTVVSWGLVLPYQMDIALVFHHYAIIVGPRPLIPQNTVFIFTQNT